MKCEVIEPLRGLLVPIESLTHDPRNARKHDEKNIKSIVASLREFGQQKPVVLAADGKTVIAGNGTMIAATRLKWTHIAAVQSGLSGDRATAFAISDNRSAELAEWDVDMLGTLVAELGAVDAEIVASLDWNIEEILPQEVAVQEDAKEDAEVSESAVPARCSPGDIWQLGDHRLMCGNSMDPDAVAQLMDGQKARLLFTSPPYGQQREYGEASGLMHNWLGLMQGVFAAAEIAAADDCQILVNLGLIHVEGEWDPYWDPWISWMRTQGWKRFGFYVWDQSSGMPGANRGRFASSHEFVFHFNRKAVPLVKAAKCEHYDGKPRAMHKSNRQKDGSLIDWNHGTAPIQPTKILDSVIRVPRNGSSAHAEGHPAPFPVGLPSYAIRSWPGLIYEPFCGSGTTMMAAEQHGQPCRGMELDPHYCDIILYRWERLTGKISQKKSPSTG